MRALLKGALASFAVLTGSMAASAAVVCNEEGDCWRVKERGNTSQNCDCVCMTTTGSGKTARSTVGARQGLAMGTGAAAFGSTLIDLPNLGGSAPRTTVSASTVTSSRPAPPRVVGARPWRIKPPQQLLRRAIFISRGAHGTHPRPRVRPPWRKPFSPHVPESVDAQPNQFELPHIPLTLARCR